MPSFGTRSLGNLAGCHPLLQEIADEAIKRIDFTVIQGPRSAAEQAAAFNSGHSQLPPGKSKHERVPAQAFDFVPCPFTDADWKNYGRFKDIAAVLLQVAAEKGIKARWGATWTANANDQPSRSLCDTDHFELVL